MRRCLVLVERLKELPLRVAPVFLVVDTAKEVWQKVLPFISEEATIRKVSETARKIAGYGEVTVDSVENHVGFTRLWISKETFTKRHVWVVDIWNGLHFRGRFEKVPNLMKARKIVFTSLDRPLRGGNSHRLGSYLKIQRIS